MRVVRVFVGAALLTGLASPSWAKLEGFRGNPFGGDDANVVDRIEISRADLHKLDEGQSWVARRVLARRAAPFRPYLVGASIAVDAKSGEVFVADTENGTVAVSGADGKKVLRVVPVGEAPEQVVVAPCGRAFVTVRDSGELVAIEAGAAQSGARAKLGGEPFGLALTADGATLYVSLARTHQIVALDAGTLAERFRVDVAAEPRGLAVTPEGDKLFVAHLTGRAVSVVDLETRAVRAIALPGGGEHAVDGGRAPNLTFALAMSPSGRRVYAPHVLEDVGAAVQPQVRSGGYGGGVFDPIVASLTAIDAEAEELAVPAMGDADRAMSFQLSGVRQPRAALVDPAHTRVFVAGLGSDDVRVLTTVLRDPAEMGQSLPSVTLATGAGPKGLAISADGRTLYVHCAFKHALAVVDVTPSPTWADYKKLALLTIGDEKWPAAAVHGRQIFYSNRDPRVSSGGQFACGSCHPEGKQDGMVWRLDKGPRQTPVLAGRLVGTEPYNWLGSRGSLQDNMKDTMGRLGGSGLPKKDLDDLELFITRYLDGGPTHAPVELSAVQAHGKALFESAEVGCANCHAPGTQFTDGKNHDIGTTTHEEVARLLSDRGQPPPAADRVDVLAAMVRGASSFVSTTQLLRAIGGRPVELNQRETRTAVTAVFALAAIGDPSLVNPFANPFGNSLGNIGIGSLVSTRPRLTRARLAALGKLAKPFVAKPEKAPTRLAYNTPSLSGVSATGPYFHDGSAATLRDVLTTKNPGDRMGRTSQLSSGDVDALVAYLETL